MSPGVHSLLVAALFLATAARAEDRVAVLIVPLDLAAEQQQGLLEGAADAAITAQHGLLAVPGHDAVSPNEAQRREVALEVGRRRLAAGKTALDELDNIKATQDLSAALESLRGADLSRVFNEFIDASLMKAAGHATGGELAPAKREIEAIAALSPRAEFSPTFFPPELLKFADMQKRLAAASKGELLVKTEPAGARVWVDGVYRGLSPLTVDGLGAGKHFVSASLGGYDLGQTLAPPGEVTLTLTPGELERSWKKTIDDIKRNPNGSTRDEATLALAREAKVNQLLLVIAKQSTAGEAIELTALRLDAFDGHNLRYATATLKPGDNEAVAAFFTSLVEKDDARRGRTPVHHYEGGSDDGSGLGAAGFGLMGGGVLLVATGIALGLTAFTFHNDFLATPQTHLGRSADLAERGHTYAVLSDVFNGVGIAALGTGVVLFLLDQLSKPSK